VSSRRYIVRHVLQAVSTLLFVLAFNFFLFRLVGDPVTLLTRSSIHLDPKEQAALRDELGIGDPLPIQFVNYMGDTLTGELGQSFSSGRPVSQVIASRLWPTVLLVGTATLLSTIFGIWMGIRGAWRRGSKFDTSSLFGSLVLYSMPEGWLGMILIIAFVGSRNWFPAGGYQSVANYTGIDRVADIGWHLFLPALTLTLGYIGDYVIIMRASLLEVMGEEFVLTARAKGVRDRDVRRRHAVPNALLPTFTLIFYSFGYVLGGAVIVETVFSWPGLGLLTFRSIGTLDYPVIQGIFLLFSGAVIGFNLLADLLYGYIDPRVRDA
jgi:peptide/nickel transport system permease protein